MKKQVFGLIAALFVCAVLLPVGARATNDVYAILYEDGTLVFQNGDTPEPGRAVRETYAVDLSAEYEEETRVPWGSDCANICAVSFADEIAPTSTAYWFCNFYTLERVDNIRNLNTANVTNMKWMFYACESLAALDVSGFDTSKVTDMSGMFCGCGTLRALDVSHFDTANVTDMKWMFWGCGGLTALDVSGFHTAKVTNMNCMFANCNHLTALDLSRFDTANVTDMASMFYDCSVTRLDLSGFNTSKVTSMNAMFCWSGLTTLDLSRFDTSNVTDMAAMFDSCLNLTTIFVSEKFTTASVVEVDDELYYIFSNSPSLVGGAGTRHDESRADKEYARIDTPDAPGYFTYKAAPVAYAITAAAPENGTLSVTLSNIHAATLAVAYFDASGKFVSANLQSVGAHAGTATSAVPATAATARVMLLDNVFRPLCAAFPADV